MKTIEEIRHARLMQLLQLPEYPTVQSLAVALKRNNAQVSQWKNRSKRTGGGICNIDSESARHIEQMLGKPRGWMDNDPQRDAGAPPAAAPAPAPTAPPVSTMGEEIARWIDLLPEEKRHRAFWVIYHMIRYDHWPDPPDQPAPPVMPPVADPAADPPAAPTPSPAPTATPAASPRR